MPIDPLHDFFSRHVADSRGAQRIRETAAAMRQANQRRIRIREGARLAQLRRTLQQLLELGVVKVDEDGRYEIVK
jgi:predicted transcriptional regulator